MSSPGFANRRVTLEADINEPALAAATFDLLHTLARAHRLPDVTAIYIQVTVVTEGSTHLRLIDELEARLGQLWLGRVAKVEVRDPETGKYTTERGGG